MTYTAWLSVETGQEYRLPSLEQWNYAWRAGGPTAMLLGPDDTVENRLRSHRDRAVDIFGDRCRHEHSNACTDDLTSPLEVGSLAATGIGLYDMAGNVMEILQCRNCGEETALVGRGWFSYRFMPIDPRRERRASGRYSYLRNSRNYVGFRVVRLQR